MAGLSKNNPSNRKQYNKSNPIVTSETCEKCIEEGNGCDRGSLYIARLHEKGTGKGCVCHKLSSI